MSDASQHFMGPFGVVNLFGCLTKPSIFVHKTIMKLDLLSTTVITTDKSNTIIKGNII